MKERILGRTGIKINRIGFGGIPIQRIPEEDAIHVVRRAYELGMNYFDTARAYTVSEERIGKALEDVRENVFYATKSNKRIRRELLEELDISLKNLRTDHIDVYQLHGVSSDDKWKEVITNGILETLAEAKDEGKIKHLGITSHNPEILKKIVEKDFFETVMIPFNYLTTEPSEELLPLCKKMNVGTVIMKPFGGGAFSNARTALKFLLSNKNVDVIIPGVMSVAELEENIAVSSGSYVLTEEEQKLIEKDADELGDQFCRACDYCQPCPQEISISMILRWKSFIKRMGWTPRNIERLEDWIEETESCIECETCESKCPYNLPIRELLKKENAGMTEALSSRK